MCSQGIAVGNGNRSCKRKGYAVMETCCCVPLHSSGCQEHVRCPQVRCANTTCYQLPHTVLRLHSMLS